MTTNVATLVVPAADCEHHWMIESPNGKQSFGRCTICNGEMLFDNSIEDEKRVNNSDLFHPKGGPRVQRTRNNDGYDGVGYGESPSDDVSSRTSGWGGASWNALR